MKRVMLLLAMMTAWSSLGHEIRAQSMDRDQVGRFGQWTVHCYTPAFAFCMVGAEIRTNAGGTIHLRYPYPSLTPILVVNALSAMPGVEMKLAGNGGGPAVAGSCYSIQCRFDDDAFVERLADGPTLDILIGGSDVATIDLGDLRHAIATAREWVQSHDPKR